MFLKLRTCTQPYSVHVPKFENVHRTVFTPPAPDTLQFMGQVSLYINFSKLCLEKKEEGCRTNAAIFRVII